MRLFSGSVVIVLVRFSLYTSVFTTKADALFFINTHDISTITVGMCVTRVEGFYIEEIVVDFPFSVNNEINHVKLTLM